MKDLNNDSRTRPASFMTAAAAGLLIALVSATLWGIFEETDALRIIKIMADCTTLPGVLFIGFALLGWVGSKGMFDLFGYSWYSFKGLFHSDARRAEEGRKTYYDYRMEKEEKRKPLSLPLLLTGLGFLAVGVVFTVLFAVME